MPEGPEILYSSVIIKKIINKYNLSNITFENNLQTELKNKFNNLLNNNKQTVIDVNCKGKLLWIELKNNNDNINNFIHIHYGLHGWICEEKPVSNLSYTLKFKNGKKEKLLYMEDRINLNKISLLTKEEHNKIINKLGIDIFTDNFTEEIFKKKILSKKILLANFIMNQNIFCGIGNYIKNDSMYLTKLNVTIKTNELTTKQINELYKNILYIAYSKLLTHKDNIMKYLPEIKKVNKPEFVQVPYEYKVYNRKETDDGQKVIKVKVSGRATYSTEQYINELTKNPTIKKKITKTKKTNNEIKISKKHY
jgi:formamidopyrimidine-DNA glycosylase